MELPANPQATIVADLATADARAGQRLDCFVLTQTLQFVYDTPGGAGATPSRILRPGGVLLATVRESGHPEVRADPGITGASPGGMYPELFGRPVRQHRITVRAYGNILTSIAFLTGMAAEELSEKERERDDPDFPLLVTIRAVKAGSSGQGEP